MSRVHAYIRARLPQVLIEDAAAHRIEDFAVAAIALMCQPWIPTNVNALLDRLKRGNGIMPENFGQFGCKEIVKAVGKWKKQGITDFVFATPQELGASFGVSDIQVQIGLLALAEYIVGECVNAAFRCQRQSSDTIMLEHVEAAFVEEDLAAVLQRSGIQLDDDEDEEEGGDSGEVAGNNDDDNEEEDDDDEEDGDDDDDDEEDEDEDDYEDEYFKALLGPERCIKFEDRIRNFEGMMQLIKQFRTAEDVATRLQYASQLRDAAFEDENLAVYLVKVDGVLETIQAMLLSEDDESKQQGTALLAVADTELAVRVTANEKVRYVLTMLLLNEEFGCREAAAIVLGSLFLRGATVSQVTPPGIDEHKVTAAFFECTLQKFWMMDDGEESMDEAVELKLDRFPVAFHDRLASELVRMLSMETMDKAGVLITMAVFSRRSCGGRAALLSKLGDFQGMLGVCLRDKCLAVVDGAVKLIGALAEHSENASLCIGRDDAIIEALVDLLVKNSTPAPLQSRVISSMSWLSDEEEVAAKIARSEGAIEALARLLNRGSSADAVVETPENTQKQPHNNEATKTTTTTTTATTTTTITTTTTTSSYSSSSRTVNDSQLEIDLTFLTYDVLRRVFTLNRRAQRTAWESIASCPQIVESLTRVLSRVDAEEKQVVDRALWILAQLGQNDGRIEKIIRNNKKLVQVLFSLMKSGQRADRCGAAGLLSALAYQDPSFADEIVSADGVLTSLRQLLTSKGRDGDKKLAVHLATTLARQQSRVAMRLAMMDGMIMALENLTHGKGETREAAAKALDCIAQHDEDLKQLGKVTPIEVLIDKGLLSLRTAVQVLEGVRRLPDAQSVLQKGIVHIHHRLASLRGPGVKASSTIRPCYDYAERAIQSCLQKLDRERPKMVDTRDIDDLLEQIEGTGKNAKGAKKGQQQKKKKGGVSENSAGSKPTNAKQNNVNGGGNNNNSNNSNNNSNNNNNSNSYSSSPAQSKKQQRSNDGASGNNNGNNNKMEDHMQMSDDEETGEDVDNNDDSSEDQEYDQRKSRGRNREQPESSQQQQQQQSQQRKKPEKQVTKQQQQQQQQQQQRNQSSRQPQPKPAQTKLSPSSSSSDSTVRLVAPGKICIVDNPNGTQQQVDAEFVQVEGRKKGKKQSDSRRENAASRSNPWQNRAANGSYAKPTTTTTTTMAASSSPSTTATPNKPIPSQQPQMQPPQPQMQPIQQQIVVQQQQQPLLSTSPSQPQQPQPQFHQTFPAMFSPFFTPFHHRTYPAAAAAASQQPQTFAQMVQQNLNKPRSTKSQVPVYSGSVGRKRRDEEKEFDDEEWDELAAAMEKATTEEMEPLEDDADVYQEVGMFTTAGNSNTGLGRAFEDLTFSNAESMFGGNSSSSTGGGDVATRSSVVPVDPLDGTIASTNTETAPPTYYGLWNVQSAATLQL